MDQKNPLASIMLLNEYLRESPIRHLHYKLVFLELVILIIDNSNCTSASMVKADLGTNVERIWNTEKSYTTMPHHARLRLCLINAARDIVLSLESGSKAAKGILKSDVTWLGLKDEVKNTVHQYI